MNRAELASAAKRSVIALGLEAPARRAQHALSSRTVRQDARDGQHLRMLLAFLLRADSNCVDVGAHVGGVLDDIVRLAPDGRHVAFEPIPELAERLRLRYPSVDVHNSAVSDRTDDAVFHWVTSRPAVSGLNATLPARGEDVKEIRVRLERLDDVITRSTDLLKIDVEGAEEAVLRGAVRVLEKNRPVVVFEHGAAARQYGTRPETIFDLLDDLRMRIFDLAGEGPYSRQRFVDSFESGARWNYVAH
jgi:FkbM family methyltransferase